MLAPLTLRRLSDAMNALPKCLICGLDLIRVPGHPDVHPCCAGEEGNWHTRKDWAQMVEQLDALELLPTAAIVLVCGGREYADTTQVERTLELLNRGAILRHGGAPGADALAGHVWKRMGGRVEVFEADWAGPCGRNCPRGHRRQWGRGGTYCPAAGPNRNRRMAGTKPKPDVGIAFPGGKGTADMVATLRVASIPVRIVPERLVAPKRALPTKPRPARRAS